MHTTPTQHQSLTPCRGHDFQTRKSCSLRRRRSHVCADARSPRQQKACCNHHISPSAQNAIDRACARLAPLLHAARRLYILAHSKRSKYYSLLTGCAHKNSRNLVAIKLLPGSAARSARFCTRALNQGRRSSLRKFRGKMGNSPKFNDRQASCGGFSPSSASVPACSSHTYRQRVLQCTDTKTRRKQSEWRISHRPTSTADTAAEGMYTRGR